MLQYQGNMLQINFKTNFNELYIFFVSFKIPLTKPPLAPKPDLKKGKLKIKAVHKKWDEYQTFITPHAQHLANTVSVNCVRDEVIVNALLVLHKNCIILQRAYPVGVIEQLYNPKIEELSFDLIFALTRYICARKGPGAILIFLPGMMDISKLHRMITESSYFPKSKHVVFIFFKCRQRIRMELLFLTIIYSK